MSKLRLVVIGAGSWAVSSHLPQLERRRDAIEMWGVCRPGPAQLERIRADWGFVHASEDYRDVLSHGADIAVIASPTALHYEHARAAMEAGAHVLVEKPFTTSTAEATALVEQAARLDRHLVVSYGFNYLPMVVEARQRLVELGGIGPVEQIVILMSSGTRELLAGTGAYARASTQTEPDTATWTDPALSGGGYAQAQLTHALALAQWLQGFRVTAVTALGAQPLGGRVEQHAVAILELADGGIATISGASAHQAAVDQLQIRMVGRDGQFEIEMEHDLFRYFRTDSGDATIRFANGSGRYECDGPPQTLVDLALGIPTVNRSPGWLGAATVSTLEALYRSLVSGTRETTEVWNPEDR